MCFWNGERGTTLHLFIHCQAIQPALNQLACLLKAAWIRILFKTSLSTGLYTSRRTTFKGFGQSRKLSNDQPKSNYMYVFPLNSFSSFRSPLLYRHNESKAKSWPIFHYYRAKHSNASFLEEKWNHNSTLFTIIDKNIFWLIRLHSFVNSPLFNLLSFQFGFQLLPLRSVTITLLQSY